MDDVFGRIFSYLVIIFAMFVIPLVWIFNNADMTQQSYISEQVQTFTSKARSTGCITKDEYRQFAENIGACGNAYQIKILHESKVSTPLEDKDGNTIKNKYRTSFRSYNLDDIVNTIEGLGNDGEPGTLDDETPSDYIMKDGDYITVSVKSVNSTEGSALLGMLSGHASGIKIVASAGGMVGNTQR
jgi:ABC-type glycerol-3-phosphate transport system permease component